MAWLIAFYIGISVALATYMLISERNSPDKTIVRVGVVLACFFWLPGLVFIGLLWCALMLLPVESFDD